MMPIASAPRGLSIVPIFRSSPSMYDTTKYLYDTRVFAEAGFMVFVLAPGASLANALTTVFPRLGVENAPPGSTLRLTLLPHPLPRRLWLLLFSPLDLPFPL